MKEKKIKVLVIGFTDNIGGIETFYMSYYRKLDFKKYQIDFIKITDQIAFEKEILINGGKIYKLENFKKNPIKYAIQLSKILKHEKYDIVHSNMLSAANIIPLQIAKKYNINKIIAHSHNNDIPKGRLRKILHKINKYKIKKNANVFLACSNQAGIWMFGEDIDFKVIHNAIECKKFMYQPDTRKKIRNEMQIHDEFVIGHIGRFCEQKNQEFMINVFREYVKINNKSILILIGNGKDKDKIYSLVSQYNITKNVIIIDNCDNIWKYYNIFDIFVLPSKFEGLGIVAIEAQANGLPCIFSNNVIENVKINNNVSFLELDEKIWINKIEELFKNSKRENSNSKIINSDYNIDAQFYILDEIYSN